MDMYSVLLAGISGAIGGVVYSLLLVKFPEKKVLSVILGVGLFFVINIASKTYILPIITADSDRAEVEEILLALPVFVTIKNKEPLQYDAIVNILAEGSRKGLSTQRLHDMAQEKIGEIAIPRLQTTTDDALLAYIGIMIEESEILLATGGDECYKFFFPHIDGGVIVKNYIPEDLFERDLATLNQIIINSNTVSDTIGEEEYNLTLAPVISVLQQIYSDDLDLMNSVPDNLEDKRKVCNITIDLYHHILALSDKDSANLLRRMFSQI